MKHNFRQRCTDKTDCDCSKCCLCYTCVFDRRSKSLYSGMQSRLKQRVWKTGKKQGQVRVEKREVPYTLEQFQSWLTVVLEDSPECEYCHQAININTISPDHSIPMKRGGSLELKNLRGVCMNCQVLKGSLLPGEFRALVGLVEQFAEYGRTDIYRRMKGGTVRFAPKKQEVKATNVLVIPKPIPRKLSPRNIKSFVDYIQ